MNYERMKRARIHALLFIKRNENIRSVSERTGYSRATVSNDLHLIKDEYPPLYEKVLEKINFHKSVRHIRGGESNRKRIEKRKK